MTPISIVLVSIVGMLASAEVPMSEINDSVERRDDSPSWRVEWREGIESGCLAGTRIADHMTPPFLLGSAIACTQKSDYEAAAWLYSMAGFYLQFDKRRTTDPFNNTEVLLEHEFWTHLLVMQRESMEILVEERQQDHCRDARDSEPPSYFPTYYLEGAKAAKSSIPLSQLVRERFDSKGAWQTITTTNECSEHRVLEPPFPWDGKEAKVFQPITEGSVRCEFSGSEHTFLPNQKASTVTVRRDIVIDLNKQRTIEIGSFTLFFRLTSKAGPIPESVFILRVSYDNEPMFDSVYPLGSKLPENQFGSFTGKITLRSPGLSSILHVSCSTELIQ